MFYLLILGRLFFSVFAFLSGPSLGLILVRKHASLGEPGRGELYLRNAFSCNYSLPTGSSSMSAPGAESGCAIKLRHYPFYSLSLTSLSLYGVKKKENSAQLYPLSNFCLMSYSYPIPSPHCLLQTPQKIFAS